MSYTNGLDKPSDYFNTVLYTGNASTQSITGVGFQPDLVWIKQRNGTGWHQWVDAVRGSGKRINSNDTGAEYNDVNGLTSFDTDGFSLGTSGDYNGSGNTQVSWNWLASNTTASNTDGSITSTVSANTTSGFSIVSWTNASDGTATCGHGLNSAPEIIITKKRSTTNDWYTYTTAIDGSYDYLALNTLSAKNNSTRAAPTSSVFTTDMGDTSTAIAYVFHSIKGYSKIGSYTGNGNADGTFVYTGFKPAFVMVKRTDAAEGWGMFDDKRDTYNPVMKRVEANDFASERTDLIWYDFLSNGFKARQSYDLVNASGGTYIYMCFAESPFTTSIGIPTTAR